MPAIAYDIETVPIPWGELGPEARDRFRDQFEYWRRRQRPQYGNYDLAKIAELLEGTRGTGFSVADRRMLISGVLDSESPFASASKARAMHPSTGFVCCIALAVATQEGVKVTALSAQAYEGEAGLLTKFWAFAKKQDNVSRWVTFNGKRFDAPFLLKRSIFQGVTVTRTDVVDTHRWQSKPHIDLMRYYGGESQYSSLAEVAENLGLEMSAEARGADMAARFAAGDTESIEAHCKEDAAVTLRAYLRMNDLVNINKLR